MVDNKTKELAVLAKDIYIKNKNINNAIFILLDICFTGRKENIYFDKALCKK